MRRNHMELLKHQRDETVHEGIRTTQHSLAELRRLPCEQGDRPRAPAARTHFCEGCHSYAAVKLDCFECHADQGRKPRAPRAGAMQPTSDEAP